MGYWEPQHGKDGTLGIGSVFPEAISKMKVSEKHLLTIVDVKSNKPFVYFTGAAWDKAGIITNSREWFQHLKDLKEEIERPVKIEWLQ
jgi:hypothetical protein